MITSLHHCIITSLHHYIITSLHHYIITSLHHFTIISSNHCSIVCFFPHSCGHSHLHMSMVLPKYIWLKPHMMDISTHIAFLPQWFISGNNQTYVEMLKFCLVGLGFPVAWDMSEICMRYAWDMPEICLRYSQEMTDRFLRDVLGFG